ncbi:MAG: bactofilin family protein [Micavibrio sp.]
MFHRPKSETENNTAQGSLLKDSQRNQDRNQARDKVPGRPPEKSPVENYVKTEKENRMYQNQPNTQPASKADETETEGNAPQNRPIDIPGNPAGLQRAGQPPRMPGAFPGTSYANAPAAGGYQAQPAKAPEGRRLVVGEGISLSGEIEACDTLIVEGTIEAALKGAKVLEIAETGVFYGTVEIEEATVAGRFEGDLTVNGRLTIRASGSITGAIAYKELAVEAGAVLDGKVTPLSGKVEKKSDGSRSQGQKKAPVRNDNSDNELPFSDKAMTA